MSKHTISLKERIAFYLRKIDRWENGGEIERLTLSVGFKASNGSRRCRELVEEGRLERKEEKGSVWYKYLPRQTSKTVVKTVERNGERVAVIKQETLYV